jgi:hypothetical protein
MEEGKINTVWCMKKSSMYIRMCYLGGTLLLAMGFGSISAPFGEPASRFTSAIRRSGKMEEGKIAAQFGYD